jgi:hypothetical protein
MYNKIATQQAWFINQLCQSARYDKYGLFNRNSAPGPPSPALLHALLLKYVIRGIFWTSSRRSSSNELLFQATLTMASASTRDFDALSEAAKNTDIPDVDGTMCWPMLMMFLSGKGVNTATRTEADWKRSFHRHRRLLRKELEDDKGKVEERSPSSESERKSETVSLSDSAYHSESPQDRTVDVCCSPKYIARIARR